MKFRNGFVSNSSSCAFLLKRFPLDFTTKQIIEFFGMKKGTCKNRKYRKQFAEYIKSAQADEAKQSHDWLSAHGKEILDRYYACDTSEFRHPIFDQKDTNTMRQIFSEDLNDYFEIEVSDHCWEGWQSEAGCAYGRTFITQNGLEINCH